MTNTNKLVERLRKPVSTDEMIDPCLLDDAAAALERLEARTGELKAALQRCEWSAWVCVKAGGLESGSACHDHGCPVCYKPKRDGHGPGCVVANALREPTHD